MLITCSIPLYGRQSYFIAKHHRQALGFDGPDLENQHWTELEEGSQKIPKSDIEHLNDGHYRIHSQSDPQLSYNVHLDSSSCDCPSFPLLSFCKHIIATQLHFPLACTIIPFPMAPDAAAPARSPPAPQRAPGPRLARASAYADAHAATLVIEGQAWKS